MLRSVLAMALFMAACSVSVTGPSGGHSAAKKHATQKPSAAAGDETESSEGERSTDDKRPRKMKKRDQRAHDLALRQRIQGTYFAESGLRIEFAPALATVRCKQISSELKYRIKTEGDDLLVDFEDQRPDVTALKSWLVGITSARFEGGAGSFRLKPDGRLETSGVVHLRHTMPQSDAQTVTAYAPGVGPVAATTGGTYFKNTDEECSTGVMKRVGAQ
jgi:hypothetical protein